MENRHSKQKICIIRHYLNKLSHNFLKENCHGITPTVVYNYTRNWIYDENAPWTMRAQMLNDPQNPKHPRQAPLVPPLREWFFFRGDKVIL